MTINSFCAKWNHGRGTTRHKLSQTSDASLVRQRSSPYPDQRPNGHRETALHDAGPLFRPRRQNAATQGRRLRTAGLFAGIGGIELGLHASGHESALLCEIEPTAAAVLRHQFAGVPVVPDVRDIDALPDVDLIAAGFPCQDLSQAGNTAGISGERSGLVGEVFRLVEAAGERLSWLLLENVPFMLQLDNGRAMDFLTRSLDALGLSWAYRVVDTSAFGLPQRRRRVILLASRTHDPRDVLLVDDAGDPGLPRHRPGAKAYGFYWTEGLRGVGWAVDCVPTLKGGSTIGIPSPPGIWMVESGNIVTPDIRDAERLQGFPVDWTLPGLSVPKSRVGQRWKMVGNAVSVPLARWVGERLLEPGYYRADLDSPLARGQRWPLAAWGRDGVVCESRVSSWPVREQGEGLADFLRFNTKPLSARAAAGFLDRARRGTLRFADGFLEAIERHRRNMIVTDVTAA